MKFYTLILFLMLPAMAMATPCTIADMDCLSKTMLEEAAKIETPSWRDQTYREIAKTLASNSRAEQAVAIIDKVENPDTKALTIRGIGMNAANNNTATPELFASLREKAELITHPPSYAIALTYIAMAQAVAKDVEGSWKTAADIENTALRDKAYGETAEILAKKEMFNETLASLEKIDTFSFKNKAYTTVSKILADTKQYDNALILADKIDNSYKKSQAIQYVLSTKNHHDSEAEHD